MKRHIIASLFILITFTQKVKGQDTFLDSTHPDYIFAQDCYQELQAIIGETRLNLPQLLVSQSKESIALYTSKPNQIIIEQATLNICKNFGENGRGMLIYLLGHEFRHFKQQQEKNINFATSYLSTNTFLSAQKQLEVEADQYGIFAAYLGGYSMIDIPPFLDSIYKKYELSETLDNYPSLMQRKAFSEKATKHVKELINIYEIGNYYNAMGYYLPAVACYQYLLRFIQTKELHNNLGSVILGLVLSHERFPFYLPIEADWTPCIQRRDGLFLFESKNIALETALQHFEQALAYDNKYFPAKINSFCALFLMQTASNTKALQERLVVLKSFSLTKDQKATVACLEGLWHAAKNENKLAKNAFDKAKNWTTKLSLKQLIKHNIKVLNKGTSIQAPQISYSLQQSLDNIDLSTISIQNQSFDAVLTLYQGEDYSVKLHHKKLLKSKLSCLEIEGTFEPEYWWLQRIHKKSLQTQQNIEIGSSIEQLQNAYKKAPFYGHVLKNGEVISYPQTHQAFQIKNLKIVEWAIESH